MLYSREASIVVGHRWGPWESSLWWPACRAAWGPSRARVPAGGGLSECSQEV